MTANSLRHIRRDYERVLAGVFGLLIHCGADRQAISVLTDRAFASAVARARSFSESGGGELAVFGLVLDAWHRNRLYLTARGKPKAIPLLGGAPSVQALIREQGPQFETAELARRIQSLRLISRSAGNRYRPSGDTALVSIYSPIVLQYVAHCLMSLLETVEDNLRGAPSVPPLFERSAVVPDLPAECIESFQQFSRFQGAIFLRTINDWLEMRRARIPPAKTRKYVRAGVHVHAYIAQSRSRGTKRSSN